MNAQKCSGCPNNLKGISFLQCCRCADKYHHTCLNISKESYQSLSKEAKDKWVCPACRCKEPKQGDNSNTPVRQAPVASSTHNQAEIVPAPYSNNITLRSKLRTTTPTPCECLSADIIREIIREELDRKFNSQITDIQLKLTALEEKLTDFKTEHDQIKFELTAQRSLIHQLQSENEQLRVSTADLTHRMKQTEILSRACNIEIQCVPENKNENLYNTVRQLASTVNCPVSDSDLHYCTRIAKLNTNSPRPRSILVKFSNRRLRDTFLASVIKFNRNNSTNKLNTSHLGIGGNKKSAVFVCEHLAPDTKQLHAEARRKAKELNYRYCWVRDGKVFLRKTDTSNYIIVRDRVTLSNLS